MRYRCSKTQVSRKQGNRTKRHPSKTAILGKVSEGISLLVLSTVTVQTFKGILGISQDTLLPESKDYLKEESYHVFAMTCAIGFLIYSI